MELCYLLALWDLGIGIFWSTPLFSAISGPPRVPPGTYFGGEVLIFLEGSKGGGLIIFFLGGGPKCLSRECAKLHKLLLNLYDKQTDIVNISFLLQFKKIYR